MIELPLRVRIGPFVYEIVTDVVRIREHESEHGSGVRGFTDHQKLFIAVDATMAPGMQRQTLWHEIKHAAVEMFHGGSDEGREEQWIGRMAPMELAVLRQNPDVVRFLLAEDGG